MDCSILRGLYAKYIYIAQCVDDVGTVFYLLRPLDLAVVAILTFKL